jgi:hypothetical protein
MSSRKKETALTVRVFWYYGNAFVTGSRCVVTIAVLAVLTMCDRGDSSVPEFSPTASASA